jgi:hypothetical protein
LLFSRVLRPALAVPALTLTACAGEPPPPAVCPSTPAPAPVAAPAPPPPVEPYLRLRLQPHSETAKYVHVDIELFAQKPLGALRLASGTVDLLTHATLADGTGAIPVVATPDGTGVVLTPERSPSGVVRLSYDITANSDSPWHPLAERVQDDRFIGAGEGLVVLPDALLDDTIPVELVVDGAPLKVPNAASTLGIGATHRMRGRPRALRHATFLAGSMGAAEFDTSEGHDEDAWLGYTAFDPRPVSAEIAGVRTSLAELFHAGEPPRGTVLFVTQPRPLGSYTTTPRSGGILLQLGPSEQWTAPLRVSVAQQLVRPWLGGELWVGPYDTGHVAESYWFTEGVARFFVTRHLAVQGLLRPDELRDEYAGETSVIVASPYRGKGNVELAALASTDDVARAHLVARGALYAARINALVRDKSKGGWSLDTILLELLAQARKEQKPLPASAWVEAVVRTLGEREREAFTRTIERGEEVVLPANVLGHCFRSTIGDYVDFDLGFDEVATREGKGGVVVGLEPKGPAARAGLRPGDVVEAEYRNGHTDVPAKLTVKRGAETLHLSYTPAGARHKGPTWTRLPATPDEKCTDAF